jgi:hypothetical protein
MSGTGQERPSDFSESQTGSRPPYSGPATQNLVVLLTLINMLVAVSSHNYSQSDRALPTHVTMGWEGSSMTNRIPRKSAARIAARIVVTVAVLLLATFAWQQLSELDAPTSNVSEPVQYGYLAYSGEDIWHAFPIGR